MLLQIVRTEYPIGANGQYSITSRNDCVYRSVALIENYYSLIWVDRYSGYGEFELKIAATRENIINLKENYYILAPDISEHAMIIEKIDLISDYEDGDYLLVSGRSLESILDRRIVYNKLTFNGRDISKRANPQTDPSMVRNVIETIYFKNINGFVDVDPIKRSIPEFAQRVLPTQNQIAQMDNHPFLSMFVTAEILNSSCYEIIKNICDQFGIGFKVTMSPEQLSLPSPVIATLFTLTLYYGLNLTSDLSQNQSGKVVVFSEVFNNLTSSEYSLETRDCKNFVKIDGIYHEQSGEEETEVPITAEVVGSFYNKNNVLNEATNIFRRETYLDASNVSDKITAAASISYTYPPGELFIASIADKDLLLSSIEYSEAAHFEFIETVNKWYYEEKDIFISDMLTYGIVIYLPPGTTSIGDGSTITISVNYNSEYESQINQDAFIKRLKNEGNGVLIENDILEDFTAEVLTNITYKYGEDYSLGDIVTFNNKYGVIYNCRITEVTFSDDENGFQIIPSFSVESSNLNQLES